MNFPVNAERKSDCELISSRVISSPLPTVFEAWKNPETFKKWWVPKSFPITLETCQMDVRTHGSYRLTFRAGDQIAEFYGKYREVTPNSQLVWTNEEGGPELATVTTVSFKEVNGGTLVTVRDLYPSKVSLDEAISSGSCGAMPEQLQQLEELLAHKQKR